MSTTLTAADFGRAAGQTVSTGPSPALLTYLLELARINVNLIDSPDHPDRVLVAVNLEAALAMLAGRMDCALVWSTPEEWEARTKDAQL